MLMLSGCEHNSEQVAAEVLGYTQVSWENLSGNEPQPSSHKKSWSELRHSERVAAVLLGYTGKVWDNESGSEPQPASAKKQWSQLSPCADEGRYADGVHTCRAMFVHIAISSLVWWMLLCERASVCTYVVCMLLGCLLIAASFLLLFGLGSRQCMLCRVQQRAEGGTSVGIHPSVVGQCIRQRTTACVGR